MAARTTTYRADDVGKVLVYGAGELGESVNGEKADASPPVGEGMSVAMTIDCVA